MGHGAFRGVHESDPRFPPHPWVLPGKLRQSQGKLCGVRNAESPRPWPEVTDLPRRGGPGLERPEGKPARRLLGVALQALLLGRQRSRLHLLGLQLQEPTRGGAR